MEERELVKVELHGVDFIPEAERHSAPADLFYVFLGSQFCFGIIVIGSLPIALGLGWWAAAAAITAGLAVGSLLFAPLAGLGAKTGTNGPVGSGAHFGVRGRRIGGVISIFVVMGFYCLTVWTGGEALVTGFQRLAGFHGGGPHALAMGAAIICCLTIIVALYGHDMIVATERLVSYGIGAILLVVAIGMAPFFDPHYAGGPYALGGFWPTWFLAAAICGAVPVSYATVVNDYSRYVPGSTSDGKLAVAAGAGMFLGCWVSLIFAAFVTTTFTAHDAPFVATMIGTAPPWAVVLLVVVGAVGSQPQGSLCLYNAGLGLQTLGWNIDRLRATLFLSAFGLVVVFSGIYLVNMTDMVLAFLAIIEVAVAPWLAVATIGHWFVLHGRYVHEDLLRDHGRYWYRAGWNPRGVAAWAAGVGAGLLFIHSAFFTGPLADAFGGVSVELVASYLVGALVYGGLQWRR